MPLLLPQPRNVRCGTQARLRPIARYGKERRAFPCMRRRHFPHPSCRSSVVEHSLGKGEVVSSILTGSTRRALIGQLRQTGHDETLHGERGIDIAEAALSVDQILERGARDFAARLEIADAAK